MELLKKIGAFADVEKAKVRRAVASSAPRQLGAALRGAVAHDRLPPKQRCAAVLDRLCPGCHLQRQPA